mmetsp:Transcript_18251/g.25715  ORF Transcript_18251/g.25715 Transcript_18251/m.25715 type:complete len:1096 (-) Transcript_18251:96-3383(-)
MCKSDTAMEENVNQGKGDGNGTGTSSDEERPFSLQGESTDGTSSYTLVERISRWVARNPWKSLIGSFVGSFLLSFVALTVGNFSVAADNGGWTTRGTLIANRHSQNFLARLYRYDLFLGNEEVWDDLLTNVQPGWETDDDDDDRRRRQRRMMEEALPLSVNEEKPLNSHRMSSLFPSSSSFSARPLIKIPSSWMERRLEEQRDSTLLKGCNTEWYNSSYSMTDPVHLWPVWKPRSKSISALDPEVIHDMCVAEQNTLDHLVKNKLCYGCDTDDKCLPPYGLVFYVRLTVSGFDMDCKELSEAWAPYQQETEEAWKECAADTKLTYKEYQEISDLPESCPYGFFPTLLDEYYGDDSSYASTGNTDNVQYTSSIFPTISDSEALFEELSNYDRASNSEVVKGAYDTQYEDFVNLQLDASLNRDMSMAMGSAVITSTAILIHTRSPFLTFVGLFQIILSFPLAYFVYYFIAGLEFFPFLNFIGVFVVFALGADDIFVAVDKWKNARIDNKDASTEDIAAKAFPDAAGAMFLTTLTTAVAFFGTAICPVAPIKCFAVFCGLLIIFDYILCILLILPALCVYDGYRNKPNCCMVCRCCRKKEISQKQDDGGDDEEAGDENGVDENEDAPKTESLIRRILTGLYNGLHTIRWPLFVGCVVAFILSTVFASKLELPTTSDVRLLNSKKFQQEQNYEWRANLLFNALNRASGSRAFVTFGTIPADTGDHNNPETFTQLVLDDSFDPSSTEAQLFLLDFCPRLLEQDFASEFAENYVCSMNKFDFWLKEQYNSSLFEDETFVENCGDAKGIPVAQEKFHSCMIYWNQAFEYDYSISERNGKVQILTIPYKSRVSWGSPFQVLDDEWHLTEAWMKREMENAPEGAKGAYFTSEDFWWYDTNNQMLGTAYNAAAIALATAGIVIFFSSRSFVLTFFAIFTIGYVLTSVTATMSALGWTLGFLESICFAILIGISCDFVIHFSHAYAILPGRVSRGERTKYALIMMGPSILAAAFTTISAAIIMLFTVISFFQKFAIVLLFTVLQSTLGSFVVFLTLADCIGPNEPTYLFNELIAKCASTFKKDEEKIVSRQTTVTTRESTAEASEH